jgi:hypothetical protein
MGILHFQNANCGYLRPIEATIRFTWDGLVRWLEQQSVWVLEIHGDLACPTRFQFVTPCLWQLSQCFERIRSSDFI